MNLVESKVINTVLNLQKLGYSESTLKRIMVNLFRIANAVDLDSSDLVNEYISELQSAESFKHNLCYAYGHYVKFNGILWNKPKYQRISKLPIVPTEERINLIIANASRKYALILSIMRDTGIRPIEVSNLTLNDVDLDRDLISIRTAKGGNPRQLKLKSSTTAMFIEYVKKHNFKVNDRLFPSSGVISCEFVRIKNTVANKLQDAMIKKIRLYDLRHHYATSLYAKTRDILLVKENLGHKSIENTLIYTHLVNLDSSENYICKTAKTITEASSLIENGFDYVTEIDDIKVFRKRK